MKRVILMWAAVFALAVPTMACDDSGESGGDSDSDTDSDWDKDTDTDLDTATGSDTNKDTETDTGTDDGMFDIVTEMPLAQVLLDYAENLATIKAEGLVTWTWISGALPNGIAFETSGLISGVPEAGQNGEYLFTVGADDGTNYLEKEVTLIVPDVLLMSGFEPFGSYITNPSYDSLVALHETIVTGFDVRVLEIPVTWANGWVELRIEIERLLPTAIIATGVAGSGFMRHETIAQNVKVGIDNNGLAQTGSSIVQDGPATIAATLPSKEMAKAMNAEGYLAYLSDNAGTFLCNFAFYNLMYYIENEATYEIEGGFIHVPPAPTSLYDLEDITAAHIVGIGVLSEWMELGKKTSFQEATVHSEPEYDL